MPLSSDDDWRLFLKELDRWAKSKGTAQVPQTATTRVIAGKPYPLGRRVNYYRQQYRNDALAPERIRALETRNGWTWGAPSANRHDQLWRTKYHEVIELVDEHGGALAEPPRWVHNWLYQQRRKLRDGELSDERERLLRQVPGALEGYKSQVPSFVAAAEAWLKAGGARRSMADLTFDTDVELDGSPYPLGKRAWYYRRRRRGAEGSVLLAGDEAARIERLRGWQW